jgi:hypothetical protein
MDKDREMTLSIRYGLVPVLRTILPWRALVACTVREAIEAAIKAPQAPGSPEERTAAIVAEALRTGRQLDIELSAGSGGGRGTPVALDDAFDLTLAGVSRSDGTERTAMEQEVTVSLSEPWRGGDRR